MVLDERVTCCPQNVVVLTFGIVVEMRLPLLVIGNFPASDVEGCPRWILTFAEVSRKNVRSTRLW